MGKQHAELDERLTEFILDHPIFFVAHRAVPAALGRGPGQVSALVQILDLSGGSNPIADLRGNIGEFWRLRSRGILMITHCVEPNAKGRCDNP